MLPEEPDEFDDEILENWLDTVKLTVPSPKLTRAPLRRDMVLVGEPFSAGAKSGHTSRGLHSGNGEIVTQLQGQVNSRVGTNDGVDAVAARPETTNEEPSKANEAPKLEPLTPV